MLFSSLCKESSVVIIGCLPALACFYFTIISLLSSFVTSVVILISVFLHHGWLLMIKGSKKGTLLFCVQRMFRWRKEGHDFILSLFINPLCLRNSRRKLWRPNQWSWLVSFCSFHSSIGQIKFIMAVVNFFFF